MVDGKDVRLAEVSLRDALIIGIYLVKLMTAEGPDLRAAQSDRALMTDASNDADALLQFLGHAGNG